MKRTRLNLHCNMFIFNWIDAIILCLIFSQPSQIKRVITSPFAFCNSRKFENRTQIDIIRRMDYRFNFKSRRNHCKRDLVHIRQVKLPSNPNAINPFTPRVKRRWVNKCGCTFLRLWMKPLRVTIQMKAIEQYFQVVLFIFDHFAKWNSRFSQFWT